VQICFIACKVKQLFSVLYGVVRAVHEFDFWFVTYGTASAKLHAVNTLMYFTGSVFFPESSREV